MADLKTTTVYGDMYVNSRVGIGTNNPSYGLVLIGSGSQATPVTIQVSGQDSTNAGDARIVISQSPSQSDLVLMTAGCDTRSDGLTGNDQYVTAGQRLNLYSKGNGSTYNTQITLGSGTAYGDIAFYTTGANGTAAERMRISGSGAVGIGTSTMSSYKTVIYDNQAGWTTLINNAANGTTAYICNGSGYGMYLDAGSNASNSTYALNVNKSGNTFLFVRGDGNVGIGVNPTVFKLQVSGTVGPDVDNTFDIGASATKWKTLYVTNITASNIQGTLVGGIASALTASYLKPVTGTTIFNSGSLWPSVDAVYTLGDSSKKWAQVTANQMGFNYWYSNVGVQYLSWDGTNFLPSIDNFVEVGSSVTRFKTFYGKTVNLDTSLVASPSQAALTVMTNTVSFNVGPTTDAFINTTYNSGGGVGNIIMGASGQILIQGVVNIDTPSFYDASARTLAFPDMTSVSSTPAKTIAEYCQVTFNGVTRYIALYS